MSRKLTFEIEITDDSKTTTIKTIREGEFSPAELLGYIELLRCSAMSNNYAELTKLKPAEPTKEATGFDTDKFE